MEKASLEIEMVTVDEQQLAVIRFCPDLKMHEGETAELKLTLRCKADHHSPVNKRIVLFSKSFKASKSRHTLRYKCPQNLFTYEGNWITLVARATIVVGSSRLLKDFQVPLDVGNIHVSEDLTGTLTPEDKFSRYQSFMLLRVKTKLELFLCWGGGLVLLSAAERMLRETLQNSHGEAMTIFFVLVGVAGSILIYLAWLQTRELFSPGVGPYFRVPDGLSLRRKSKRKISRGMRFQLSDWFSGPAQTDLHGARLRVVAGNIERCPYRTMEYKSQEDEGQLVRKEKTVITRPIVLYDKTVEHLPLGAPVEEAFDEVLDFEPMFTDLYPPDLVAMKVIQGNLSLDSSHGLAYYLEFQLLHPSLVDQKFEVDPDYFDPLAFFKEPAAEKGAAGVVEEEEIKPPAPPGL
ncbi:MAG: hypothetical protein MK133_09690, partial [Planctomycetes bacterium]|nr:hypothetical protein [Planctomycetota bacterium]